MSNRNPNPLAWIAELLALVRNWWQSDRVRISPREGRLLRLKPPCFVVAGSSLLRVEGRVVGQGPGGPYVMYPCTSDTGPGELWVTLGSARQSPHIRWIQDGRQAELDEMDLQIFRLDPRRAKSL